MSELEEIKEERGEKYGPHIYQHRQVGRIWAALLSHHWGVNLPDIPSDMVEVMMSAGIKATRAAWQGFHKDDYDDGMNYNDLARESKQLIDEGYTFNDFKPYRDDNGPKRD